MKIGIFGGSFDPIHNGHVNLAKYVLDHTDLDEVWLMVSPRNPLKDHGPIATDQQRLEMARLAVEGIPDIRVSDFEFHLPIPSYTYKTLTELKKNYPQNDFRLIIGGDNWADFDRWRNPQEILTEFGLIVYPRPSDSLQSSSPDSRHATRVTHHAFNSSLLTLDSLKKNVVFLQDAPQMPISSTEIRALLSNPNSHKASRPMQILSILPQSVISYIHSHHLYS